MKKSDKIIINLLWMVIGSIPALLLYIFFLRVSGDIEICKIYYPEMNTAKCYFSSKTVRVPGK